MNTKHITPTLPILGYNNESATQLTPGMGVTAGAAEGGVTIGVADALVKGVVALNQLASQNSPVACHVGHGGLCYVLSGAAFAVDAYLSVDAAGKWITSASGKKRQARALSAAAGANELVPVIRLDGLDTTP